MESLINKKHNGIFNFTNNKMGLSDVYCFSLKLFAAQRYPLFSAQPLVTILKGTASHSEQSPNTSVMQRASNIPSINTLTTGLYCYCIPMTSESVPITCPVLFYTFTYDLCLLQVRFSLLTVK